VLEDYKSTISEYVDDELSLLRFQYNNLKPTMKCKLNFCELKPGDYICIVSECTSNKPECGEFVGLMHDAVTSTPFIAFVWQKRVIMNDGLLCYKPWRVHTLGNQQKIYLVPITSFICRLYAYVIGDNNLIMLTT
jgi:hypothetical protein